MQMLSDPATWSPSVKYVLEFMLLLASGGFGGLVYSVAALLEGGKKAREVLVQVDQGNTRNTVPEANLTRRMTYWVATRDASIISYIWGQVIIGMGGAMAGIFAILTISRAITQATEADFLFKNPFYTVSLCVVSGSIANKLLPAVAQNVLRELTKVKETIEDTQEELKTRTDAAKALSTVQLNYSLGETNRLLGRWEDARFSYLEVLKRDPKHTSALIGLAMTAENEAQKTHDNLRKAALLKEALSYSNRAIAIDSSFAPAYLTRATVNAAIDIQSDEVRADLEHAIRLDKTLKPFIAEQSDLHSLYNYEWFQLLVGGEKEKAI
jgi:hypothetical protein